MKEAILISVTVLSILTIYSCQSSQNKKRTYFGQASPGTTAEIFAQNILSENDSLYQRSITFSPAGDECYWPVINKNNISERWIMESKLIDGKWTEPQIVSFSKAKYCDDVPCISPAGNMLMFLSYRPIGDSSNKFKENILVTYRNDFGWSNPAPMPSEINDLGSKHHQISIDSKGNLFFGCIADSNDNMDVYCSEYIEGEFQKPFKLDLEINSNDDEWAPFISPDGSYIIFTRGNQMGWSLHISFRKLENKWSEAKKINITIPIPGLVNTDAAFVTRDGKFLIFYTGNDEKYIPFWVDASIIDELKTIN